MSKECSWLGSLGVPDCCVTVKTAATENGRRFQLLAPTGVSVLRVRVDGCWLSGTDRRKVDYLFTAEVANGKRLCVLVELKGKEYGKALSQVEDTIKYIESIPAYLKERPNTLVAHVVLSQGNQIPRYQVQEEKLRKKYGLRIYRTSQRGEYRIPPHLAL